MSADNGVYITRWISKDGSFEYRVAECQSIENCYVYDGDDENNKKLAEASRVLMFGRSTVLNEEEASREAFRIYEEILNDDMGICEYGISKINFDIEFPSMTSNEAREYVESYFEYISGARGIRD